VFAAAVAFNLLTSAWSKVGIALSTAAVTLVVGPGAYASDKAFTSLTQLQPYANDRQADRLRDIVRRDIVRRAAMYQSYPQETLFAERIALRR